MTLVTNTLGSGTISSSELNANFSDLSAAIDSITSANISSTAGITAGQLSDRFALSPWHFDLLPITSGADLGSVASYTCAAGDVTILKATSRAKAGKSAAICLVEVYVTAIGGGSPYPLLTVKKGTTTLGGAGLPLEAAGFHYLFYTNPIDTPLISIQDNETIEFSISGQTGTPTLRGLSVTLWVKEELTS